MVHAHLLSTVGLQHVPSADEAAFVCVSPFFMGTSERPPPRSVFARQTSLHLRNLRWSLADHSEITQSCVPCYSSDLPCPRRVHVSGFGP